MLLITILHYLPWEQRVGVKKQNFLESTELYIFTIFKSVVNEIL